jgi:hypothetical protein
LSIGLTVVKSSNPADPSIFFSTANLRISDKVGVENLPTLYLFPLGVIKVS